MLAARHAVYHDARERNPQPWSGQDPGVLMPRRITKVMGGAEPPGATRSTASTGPSPQ
jgi:hypothetical protein